FSLDSNGDGSFAAGHPVFNFGSPGDLIVTGDWNGDGRTKLGVARPGPDGLLVFSLDTNGNGRYDPGVDAVFTFGLAGDRIITGDWTGDGRTKLGVARPGVNGLLALALDSNGKRGLALGSDGVS